LPWVDETDKTAPVEVAKPAGENEVMQTRGFRLKLAASRQQAKDKEEASRQLAEDAWMSNVTTNLHHGSHYCMDLAVGGGAVVRGAKQRYGTGTYLVAHPEDLPEPVGVVALHATLEQLLGECEPRAEYAGHIPWFADVGVGASEMAARASSFGCSVLVLDPEVADSRAVEMTGCVNDPDSPFLVLPSTVAGASSGDVTLGRQGNEAMDEAASPAGTAALADAEPMVFVKASPDASQAGPALVQHNYTAMHAKTAAMKTALAAHRRVQMSSAHGIALDTLFVERGGAEAMALDAQADWNDGDIAMLKITPHGCCGRNATVDALKGAWSLLKSGRVRCLVTEMNFDPNSTAELLGLFLELQIAGFQLMHAGPLDSPELEITDMGAYPLFKTDVKQLHELHDTLRKIRAFDERTGYRVYGDGLSLDRKGRYFDFTNTVVALQGPVPKRVELKEKGKLRFRDGMWWPQVDAPAP